MPLAPLSFYDRAQLAMRLFNATEEHTDDTQTLAETAKVMGAMLRGQHAPIRDAVLRDVLESNFPPDARIWELVERPSVEP